MDDEQLPTTLLSLPEELLCVVGRHLLMMHLPSAVHLASRTCKSFRSGLQTVHEAATARRLQWLPSHTMRHHISNDGRTITKTHANGHDCSCAAGPLLPVVGKSAWRVRIEESVGKDSGSTPYLGVCDASGRSEWGLDLCEGKLVHLKRNHKGQIVELGDNRASQRLGDSVCLFTGRAGCAAGAVVEIIINHDLGTLSFSVDGGPTTEPAVISSTAVDTVTERDGRRGGGRVDEVAARDSGELSRGAALRPYASLGFARSACPDCISFCDGYVYAPQ